VKIVYRVTEQDYMSAHRLFAKNEPPLRRFSRHLMVWIGVLMIIAQTLYIVVEPRAGFGVGVAGVCLGVFGVYCGFALRRHFRRSYRNNHRFRHDFNAEISEEGIEVETSSSDSRMKWASFVRFLESDEIFMVFLAQWLFLVFPKRAFAANEADQFCTLLLTHVGPAG
jgi:hypothetical protein